MTDIKQLLLNLFGHTGEAWAWWAYLLVALIPLLVFLGFRELCCWFWKFNSIDDRLRNIESHLEAISRLAEETNTEKETTKKQKDFTLE